MNQIVTRETSINQVGIATGVGGASIAPQNLGEVVRFAEVMCKADIALPKHLRGNAGACMAVALQALQWEMNPFAVASKSYSVNGIIAYEAQLIAAVVNTRSGIKGRLKYEYFEEGEAMWCRVSGTLDGEVCTYDSPPVGAITPKNSPLWKTDPRQQLGYYAARSWARRHCPEVLLGIYDREEAAAIGPENARDITPSVMTRLQSRQEAPQAREGFDPAHIASETAALTGEPDSGQSEDNSQSSGPSADDGSDGEALSPGQTVAADPSHGDEGAQAGQDGEPASPSDQTGEERAWLIKAAKMLIGAAAPGGDPDIVRRQYAALIKNETPASISQDAIAKANAIGKRMVAVCESTEELDLDLIAGLARCDVAELRT